MKIEITIPSPGESITEVELANWLVQDGDYVERDQEVAEVESDKATLPLIAQEAGKIKILIEAGTTLKVGTVACIIDTSVRKEAKAKAKAEEGELQDSVGVKGSEKEHMDSIKIKSVAREVKSVSKLSDSIKGIKVTPLARKMMEEHSLSLDDILNGIKKITTKE